MFPPPEDDQESPRRQAGVLLHVTSLPGEGGVGNLGEPAHRFLDWLEAAGQSVWQILPFQQTGFGHSPYGTLSSFAGNRLFVSAPVAARDEELPEPAPPAPDEELAMGPRVHHDDARRKIDTELRRLWRQASRRDPAAIRQRLEQLAATGSGWLSDWALYAALKTESGGLSWTEWPEDLRLRRPAALEAARRRLADEIDFEIFVQLQFDRQWRALRRAAAARGIRLLGDLPIYPALDSADVWAHQELFDLDSTGRPRHVAGVPPDYFSPQGQLWGNPVYDWERLAGDGFSWWVERLRFLLSRVDVVRLDHFRGFASYWRVPVDALDARGGEWVEGPGSALFDALRHALGRLPLVAEDLGMITPEVEALRRRYALPGMKVLQFAFDEADSEHLPHHHSPDSVVYTGTHDNDTTRGWFAGLEAEPRARARDYLGAGGEPASWALTRCALASVARLAIVPVQDLLDLGSAARMNTPGRAEGNWSWRLERGEPSTEVGAGLRRLTDLTGRLPGAGETKETAGAEPGSAATDSG